MHRKTFLCSPSSSSYFFFYVTRFFISLHRFYIYICLTVNRGIHHFDKLWELTIHLIMKKFSHFFIFLFQNVFLDASERKKIVVSLRLLKLPFLTLFCLHNFHLLFTHVFILLFSKKAAFSHSSHLTTIFFYCFDQQFLCASMKI